MKVYPIRIPYGHSAPTLWTEGEELYIQTNSYQHMGSVFSHYRRVYFSKRKRLVEIKTKRWWNWERPAVLTFGRIDYIDLSYPRLPEHEKDNPGEVYELFLMAKDPFEKIDLFSFGSPDSTSPEYQKIAQKYGDFISKFINIRFGAGKVGEFPEADFHDKYICKSCGHRLSPKAETILCPYCGGREIEIT